MNEKELIIKAQNGDSDAFGTLYDLHFTKIYRFIFIKVRHKHNAEDLSHHVFLNAWKNIGSYRHQGFPFSSWLYKIASNAVIDFYRTAKNHIDIEEVHEEKFGESNDSTHSLEIAMEMERIAEALHELTGDEQNVVIMKFVNELENKEIANALEKSEGAIRVIQHRALKHLKQILETIPEKKSQSNNLWNQ